MEDQNTTNESISNLHMENYFPKDIFSNLDNQKNLKTYHSKTFEKYFESAAKDNVERCRTSAVKEWLNRNLPSEYNERHKPTLKLNLSPNHLNSTYNKQISDYTRNAYNRIEQLKKLQEAYSLLRQKLQEKRRASCHKEVSEAEASVLNTQRLIISLKREDKDKIATELLIQNAEELGIPSKDLETLNGYTFNEALKTIIDIISNMINNKFMTNLKDRCESARRKAGSEYRDEMERIKVDLDMYKTKSEKLESTISTLNSYADSSKQNAEKVMELQHSLEDSNRQINQLKDSLYNMAKVNEELEKNEVKLEESLVELERYKLESQKLESVIKDLELLNQQKHDNEELIKMLHDELDQCKSKSLQLNKKIEDLENSNKENLIPLNNELAQAYQKLSELEHSYEQIEHQKNEADKKLESSIDEIEKQKQHSEELEQSITKLKQTIEEMEKETTDQVNDLQTCLIDANCKIESLEGTISQLKQLNLELEGGEHRIQELQSKLTESNSTIEKLEKTITELENVSSKYIDYDEKMDNLQKQLKEYTEKITVLENNASEFNYKDQAETLKTELDKSQLKIMELETMIKENSEKTERVPSPRKDNEEVDRLTSEILQLKNQVDILQNEKTDLEQKLSQQSPRKDNEEVDRLTSEILQLKNQVDILQNEKTDLEQKLSQQSPRKDNEEVDRLTSEILQLKNQVDILQNEKTDLEQKLSQQSPRKDNEEVDRLTSEILQLKNQVDILQNEKTDLEQKLSQQSPRKDNEEVDRLTSEILQLKNQVDILQNEKTDLEQKLSQISAVIEENRQYKEKIELLERKLNEINKEKPKDSFTNVEVINAAFEDVRSLPINSSNASDWTAMPSELELEEHKLYKKKSSRKGKKKSSREKETSRSDISSRSTSRHSKKDKPTIVDNNSTDVEASDSNEQMISDPVESITDQLNLVKQSTIQLTELGYDSISNVGSYLSDYIFGGN
ncbi:hypothetical protein BmR1_04g05080 [Babesia microti strain RI]|uniref:Uncharacterized protein n=1 Tax=Babesia microti (strain RI) TaxID=1133968 RepID=I7I9K8_BABMR|nr:hypothetical protein BmR1_04g05080 [Babesia microti strain RI]CCF75214.1 hypothetical protein BmR1_04g05080 [Babesia microti strain RI]|eukprot:XP_012649622.1 hypothetical protein BmR1_04g05080 [Babesia microti strain RI]